MAGSPTGPRWRALPAWRNTRTCPRSRRAGWGGSSRSSASRRAAWAACVRRARRGWARPRPRRGNAGLGNCRPDDSLSRQHPLSREARDSRGLRSRDSRGARPESGERAAVPARRPPLLPAGRTGGSRGPGRNRAAAFCHGGRLRSDGSSRDPAIDSAGARRYPPAAPLPPRQLRAGAGFRYAKPRAVEPDCFRLADAGVRVAVRRGQRLRVGLRPLASGGGFRMDAPPSPGRAGAGAASGASRQGGGSGRGGEERARAGRPPCRQAGSVRGAGPALEVCLPDRFRRGRQAALQPLSRRRGGSARGLGRRALASRPSGEPRPRAVSSPSATAPMRSTST